MKLYYVVGSPNCRKVHAVINHLGVKVEFEYRDFFSGELSAPEYLGINPNGMVPALRDGELTRCGSPTPSCSTSPRRRRPTACCRAI